MLDNIFKCANDGYLKVYRKELGVERRNGEVCNEMLVKMFKMGGVHL